MIAISHMISFKRTYYYDYYQEQKKEQKTIK